MVDSMAPMNVPRKRLLSMGSDAVTVVGRSLRKRPRLSAISTDLQIQLRGGTAVVNASLDRLPRPRSLHGEPFDFLSVPHGRPLSGCSSFPTSRAGSPGDTEDEPGSAFISREGMALMRSVSSASLSSITTNSPSYPECSAKYHLRNTKITIDFSSPPSVSDPSFDAIPPLSCSTQNVVFFGRGNRVHYKNLMTSEDIGQLCKLQDTHGDLKIIECGGWDRPDIVAISTSKGIIQLWDVVTKKRTDSWSTTSVTAMRWNGPVLTVGGMKGTIRHYDTRISPTAKMKEQVRKVTRHQTMITSLSWNADGKILASGDQSGTVYCWDSREKVPLDVGEFIQRRKKMQHSATISALAWCPWQPKLLASGDKEGIVQLWNVNASLPQSNAVVPGKLKLEAPVTSLHFSGHCKELLSTHGMKGSSPSVNTINRGEDASPVTAGLGVNCQPWPRVGMANAIAVHFYPSLRHIRTMAVAEKPIGTSVLNSNGTKLILAIPGDSKIQVCDVWMKRKELKRQSSSLGSAIR